MDAALAVQELRLVIQGDQSAVPDGQVSLDTRLGGRPLTVTRLDGMERNGPAWYNQLNVPFEKSASQCHFCATSLGRNERYWTSSLQRAVSK
jgi:hypothetical protein